MQVFSFPVGREALGETCGSLDGDLLSDHCVRRLAAVIREESLAHLVDKYELSVTDQEVEEWSRNHAAWMGLDEKKLVEARDAERATIECAIEYRSAPLTKKEAIARCFQRIRESSSRTGWAEFTRSVGQTGGREGWFDAMMQAWPTVEDAKRQLKRLSECSVEVYLFGNASAEQILWMEAGKRILRMGYE